MTEVGTKVKWAFRLSIYAGIIYAVYYFAAARSDAQIRKHATWFCTEIQKGSHPESLINSVLKANVVLVQGKLDGVERESDVFVIRFVNRPPFEDYECKIETVKGIITTIKLFDPN